MGAESKRRGRKKGGFRGERQETEGERRALRGKMGRLCEGGGRGGSRHGKSWSFFLLFRRERGKGLSLRMRGPSISRETAGFMLACGMAYGVQYTVFPDRYEDTLYTLLHWSRYLYFGSEVNTSRVHDSSFRVFAKRNPGGNRADMSRSESVRWRMESSWNQS